MQLYIVYTYVCTHKVYKDYFICVENNAFTPYSLFASKNHSRYMTLKVTYIK